MIKEIKKLLKKNKAKSLKELSNRIKIPYTKLKNISCERVKFESLFKPKRNYKIFPEKSEDLAELIGIVLGDGNIQQMERCQRLLISCDRKYPDRTIQIKHLIFKLFKKEPKIYKRSTANCDDICLYIQDIDRALGIKTGNKIKNKVKIPKWILEKRKFLIRCLKGLFETDGNYSENKKFKIQFIEFENKCSQLRSSVYIAIKNLGYNPQLGNRYVRLARKKEVTDFLNKINYFKYHK